MKRKTAITMSILLLLCLPLHACASSGIGGEAIGGGQVLDKSHQGEDGQYKVPIEFGGRFLEDEEIIRVYHDNRQVLNEMKDILLSSGLGFAHIKYKEDRLKYSDGQNLDAPIPDSLEGIEDLAARFFEDTDQGEFSYISFRKDGDGAVVKAVFVTAGFGGQGIMYAPSSNTPGRYGQIEDHWYIFRFSW